MIVSSMDDATSRVRMEATLLASQWESPGRSPVGDNYYSSASSTPFVSSPSSPRNSGSASSRFFESNAFPGREWETLDGGNSAGTGGVTLSSKEDGMEIPTNDEPTPSIAGTNDSDDFLAFSAAGSDFDFSARFSEADGSVWSPAPMSSADELFCNGQIRPLQLFSPVEQQPCEVKPTASRIDDGFFDFRSSANYTLPSPRSHAAPPKQGQRKQGFGLPKPASLVGPSTFDQWQKVGKESVHAVRTDNPIRCNDPTRERSPVASERTRRAREGSHRRARSLSPLRVFHMDDQPRPSFDVEVVYGLAGDIAKGSCKEAEQGKARARKGWTLKELLHGCDSRVCESLSAKGENWGNNGGEKSVAKGDAKRAVYLAKAAPPSTVSSRSKSGGSKQTLSPHELHYTSQRAQAEQMRKRTFLPYKQGLLGCLGFSKSYRSFAGIHTLNPS